MTTILSVRSRILIPLLVAVAAFAAGCDGDGPVRPPNVLLISIDTLRADHLGCYGHGRPTSPALDSLAAAGVRFEDVTASSPWTLPSHVSLMTGLYPNHHGVKDVIHSLKDEVPTLAGVLKAEGFRTEAVVNSINVAARYGLDHGFDSFEHVSEWQDPRNPMSGTRNAGAEIVDLGMEKLREESDQPLFLFLHFYDVHTDFTPAPEYRAQFVRPYDGPIVGRTEELIELRGKRTPLTPEDLCFLRDLYDAEIRELDDELARLFAFLDESGLAETTLVVVTSDHGEEFFDHGSLLHGRTHFRELLEIPLLLRGPGVPRDKVYGDPCALVDIAPTILGLLDVDAPAGMDGVNLENLWRNPSALPDERLLFSEADHNNGPPDRGRSIRLDRHKLIVDLPTNQSWLFDLETDPVEKVDISTRDPKMVTILRETLDAFMKGELEGALIEGPDEDLARRLKAAGY